MTDPNAIAVSGVLEPLERGGGFLRQAKYSFQPSHEDVWVSPPLIRQNGLVAGAEVSGAAQQGNRNLELLSVGTVCGLSPEAFKARTPFDKLVAVSPDRRLRLGDGGNVSMRIVDLVAPMGHGTRGLIVAQPKSGKTQLLEEMAEAIHAHEPETRIIVLLIDERPEEVTYFRRNVQAEVLASSSDNPIDSHVRLAELCLAHVRCELECGRHVVVLVDSLTRLARAFNQAGVGSRRTLSGGLDARALEVPRRFFGLARNIENGGSVTVIATAMVNTGSRMDDYIFEEFKGTGNSEIVLDRTLADQRIFPAIRVGGSGTRRDELLYTSEETAWIAALRKRLVGVEPALAMKGLLSLVGRSASNEKLMAEFKPDW